MKRKRIDWYTLSLAAAFIAGWIVVFVMVVEDLAR